MRMCIRFLNIFSNYRPILCQSKIKVIYSKYVDGFEIPFFSRNNGPVLPPEPSTIHYWVHKIPVTLWHIVSESTFSLSISYYVCLIRMTYCSRQNYPCDNSPSHVKKWKLQQVYNSADKNDKYCIWYIIHVELDFLLMWS